MSILRRFFKGFTWFGVGASSSPVGGGLGITGVPLSLGSNSRQSEGSGAVMAPVYWAMRAFVEPPLTVYVGEEAVPASPLGKLIAAPMGGLPPEEYGKAQTRRIQDQLTIASLILDGNAYLKIWRDDRGNVVGIQWLPHWEVDPLCVAENPSGLRAFRYYFGGSIRECPPEDMIHITTGLPDANDPLKSVSPVKAVLREVMTDQQIAVYTYAIMRQPNPAATITPKEGTWTQGQAEDVASVLRQRSAGESAGSVMVLGANATISKLGLTPEEMALDIIPAHVERRISAVLGISPLVSGLASDPTYSNYKTAREAATEEFLVPMWQLVADSISDALVPEFATKQRGWRLAYDLTNVRSQQEDRDALHARVREDFDKNLIDLYTAKTETGRVPENSDKGVYAWMLKSAGVAPQASKGAAARKRAEESL